MTTQESQSRPEIKTPARPAAARLGSGPPTGQLPTHHKLAYSIEEAAELISVGRTTVVALLSSGELGSIKVGGRRLVPIQDLHDFVERCRLGPEE